MNRQQVYKALCIHWDHHPLDEGQQYGAGTNADQIRAYLRTVQPDVTQYHTIGCYGYASFPSHIAPVVPGLHGDPLRIWADVCAEEGVPFGCYAASFDCQSPQPVPQWRCVNRAGEVSERQYCPNGPWTEEFFIPFMLEVMERYHPVHFWLDGVWLPSNRADHCFCPHCQKRFQQQYGHALPKAPTPSDWIELQEFYEESLDNAISRIGRAIKGHDPKVLLACNYLYFFKDVRKPMPEVDWLSWDALNTPNLHRASFESNYISTAGKPADIMVYEQGIVRWQPELLRRPRTLAQLKTEAGTILAHGARVNLWHDPQPNGALLPAKAKMAQQVAQFVRQRQNWCIDNDSVAEVAVLASRLDHFIAPQGQETSVRALQQALQESHIPCDVVHDDLLLNRLVQYQLVILPETSALNLDTAQWLHQYVTDGGSVLIVFTEPFDGDARWLEALLGEGITFKQEDKHDGAAILNGEVIQVGHKRYLPLGNWHCLVPYENGGAWLAELTLGDGRVIAITGEAISDYAQTHWPPLRNLIAHAAHEGIGQSPLVELEGHPGIELVVNRRANDLYVQLVNLTPGISFGASTEVFYDEVPVYNNVSLVIRPPRLPSSITLLPDGLDLMPSIEASECQDPEGHCTLRIQVPQLTYHVAIRLTDALGNTNA